MCVHIHTLRTYTHIYICMCIFIHTHMYICVYIYTYIHIYVCVYIYTHSPLRHFQNIWSPRSSIKYSCRTFRQNRSFLYYTTK